LHFSLESKKPVSSQIPDIADYPPYKEEKDVEISQISVVYPGINALSPPLSLKQYDRNEGKQVGNRQYQEEIIVYGFVKPAMQEGMNSTLEAASRTTEPRKHFEDTFWRKRGINRIIYEKSYHSYYYNKE